MSRLWKVAEQAGDSIDQAMEDSKEVTAGALEDAAERIEESGNALDEKAHDMGGDY